MEKVSAKNVLKDSKVRLLLKPNDYLAWRHICLRVLIEITLMYIAWYLLAVDSYFLGSLAFYILAVWHSFWGYAGIGHELMHGKVFSSKRINELFYLFSSSMVWSNPSFFKQAHLYHHSKTFYGDDDEGNSIQKWSGLSIFIYLTIDLLFMIRRLFYMLVNACGLKYADKKWISIPRAYQFNSIKIILIQSSLNFIIFHLTGDLLYNILWLILPFTGQFINRVLAQSQHIGLKHYRDQGPLKHSRSIRLPKIISFLYAGMNYHAEHHLIPSMPFYNLEAFSDILKKNYSHIVVDWHSFFPYQFALLIRSSK